MPPGPVTKPRLAHVLTCDALNRQRSIWHSFALPVSQQNETISQFQKTVVLRAETSDRWCGLCRDVGNLHIAKTGNCHIRPAGLPTHTQFIRSCITAVRQVHPTWLPLSSCVSHFNRAHIDSKASAQAQNGELHRS